MNKSVTIIGAGHSGLALLTDLKSRGFSACLYAHPDHDKRLCAVESVGGVKAGGIFDGVYDADLYTRNIEEALLYSPNVILALPSYAQDKMFDHMADHLNQNHLVVNLNGNFSSLLLSRRMSGSSCPLIVETNAAPHASRADYGGKVDIAACKEFMPVSAVDGNISCEGKERVAQLMPCKLEWHDGICAVALQAYNGVLHPAALLLNTGRVEEEGQDYLFYAQGYSKSVSRMAERIDQERLEIARRLGFTGLRTTLEALQGIYGGESRLLYDFAKTASAYQTIKAPDSIDSRYVKEDVPYVLVPWYWLGKSMGFEAKAMKSIIDLASVMHDTDYLNEGRKIHSPDNPHPQCKTGNNFQVQS